MGSSPIEGILEFAQTPLIMGMQGASSWSVGKDDRFDSYMIRKKIIK